MKKFNTPLLQQTSLIQRVRTLFLIGLMVLAAGCSTIRFTYNHGDTLLYWWLNAYLDLDSDQSDWVKKDIDKLFQWHRSTQLRDYAGLLGKMQRQLADGNVTQDELLGDYRDIKARTELLAFKALPDLADLAMSIKPDQIEQMEKKFAKNNNDYRKKFISGSVEDRQKEHFKKTMEQFNLWFGSFSREQEAQLRKLSDARPLDDEVFLQERMLRQKKIVATLRRIQQEKLNKEQTMSAVHGLLRDFFDRMDAPERKAFYDSYVDSTSKFIVAAVKLTTPEQKAHAQKRMQGWIDDLNSLAAGK
ncbi:DUF6279 family lipoprotein [Massilia sp. YIM B02763]|uniref:DUF6279 family lipoprotein n=1 Tax=Massilia sp. YIM B02763 TaxID=3050130 RepID=UPI0025B7043C|nr:DUF6279 family lipoprotein [Massilia sp. YIM B02763]MDN4055455.1 DUF6279 family lipoprotein [Massilia sp. YIM B02763]